MNVNLVQHPCIESTLRSPPSYNAICLLAYKPRWLIWLALFHWSAGRSLVNGLKMFSSEASEMPLPKSITVIRTSVSAFWALSCSACTWT